MIMSRVSTFIIFSGFLAISACSSEAPSADAYGNFEADEVTVSAQVSGQLLEWNVSEGQMVSKGDILGLIDTTAIHLQKRQLSAQMRVLDQSKASISAEGAVIQEQITSAKRELSRIEDLFKGQAATQKQRDDAESAVRILERRLEALQTQRARLTAEGEVLNVQLDVLQDQLEKAVITSPVDGTVLNDFVNAGELVSPGKPLFSVADLQYITLRVFMDALQVAELQLNQSVTVQVDDGNVTDIAGLQEYPGRVSWISSKAEFTPRTIQTREDRVTLVYAVKVEVENDGLLKIGMPGELVIQ